MSSRFMMTHTAYIGVGSNIGSYLGLNIDRALHLLRRNGKIQIVDTSSLYESRATEFGKVVAKDDQKNFYNCVAKVRTSLNPFELLSSLKQVEFQMGRDFTARRHGPRIVDLDLLLYHNKEKKFGEIDILTVDSEELQLPHPRMHERDFVLEPLKEVIEQGASLLQLDESRYMEKTLVGTVATYGPYLEWIRGTQCKKLAIMNATPDSFSDGGALVDPSSRAKQLIQLGADALDIGGESTRPGATILPVEDELNRIEPAIKAALKYCQNVSIDTYKTDVARRALDLGATVVNDVSGGADPEMLSLVASRPGVGIVLMHPREDSKVTHALMTENKIDYVDAVSLQLEARVTKAIESGIFRWRIMVDPGIGFGKTHQDSLKLLGCARRLRDSIDGKIPVMIGHSRKRFLKPSFLGIPDSEEWPSLEVREKVNAMATQRAIEGGADIVRIHY